MFQTEWISWWTERILLTHICPSSKRTTVLHCKYGQLTDSYRQALKRSPTHLLLSQFCLQRAANQESIHICLLPEAFMTTPPLNIRNTYPRASGSSLQLASGTQLDLEGLEQPAGWKEEEDGGARFLQVASLNSYDFSEFFCNISHYSLILLLLWSRL